MPLSRSLFAVGTVIALMTGIGYATSAPPAPPSLAGGASVEGAGDAARATNDPVGPSFALGAKAPTFDDRTVVLFRGGEWSGWQQRDGQPSQWEVQPDGSVQVKGGDAITSQKFRDFQLHLEFRCPIMPDAQGQARGNSGV